MDWDQISQGPIGEGTTAKAPSDPAASLPENTNMSTNSSMPNEYDFTRFQSNVNSESGGDERRKDDELIDEAAIQDMGENLFKNLFLENNDVGNLPSEKLQLMSAMTEKAYGRELSSMLASEREANDYEIHAIQSLDVPETNFLVSKALRQLRIEIDENLSSKLEDESYSAMTGKPLFSKAAYMRGLELKSDYIQSDIFRIRFLRADRFDVIKAALRYFRYLDLLYNYFGDEALKRPLLLTDLTKRELIFLRTGYVQLSSSRDRLGRRICFLFGWSDFADINNSIEEIFRARAYLNDVLALCEATQKLGCITVAFISDIFPMTAHAHVDSFLYNLRRMRLSFPVRLVSFHFCIKNNMILRLIAGAVFAVFGRGDRARVRLHAGSVVETNYYLGGFGISPGDVPITYDGVVKKKYMAKFLRARNTIESFQTRQINILTNNFSRFWTISNWESAPNNRVDYKIISACPIMECPTFNCVVFGDKDMYDHPANVLIRDLVLKMEQQRMERIILCDETLSVSLSAFIDEIVHEARSIDGLTFFAYDKDLLVYKEINDVEELKKRFHRVVRDVRMRLKRGNIGKDLSQEEAIGKGRRARSGSEDSGGGSSILGSEFYKRSKNNGSCSC